MSHQTEEDPQRLQLLLGWVNEQRAKDLIDRNEGELDPRRAICRLHRALSYARTSIQASKAYQDLGMWYEELGNVRLAIKYYTEAIELEGMRYRFSEERAFTERVLAGDDAMNAGE